MNTMIDIYREEIAAALEAGDSDRIARVAESFCQRCHFYLPWKIVGMRSHLCPLDGLQVFVDIEYRDKTRGEVMIGFVHGKRRLILDGERIGCSSSADVIHVLQVPCCFFDGIYYAWEGFSESARHDLRAKIEKWDRDARDAEQKYDQSYQSFCRADRAHAKAISKLNATRNQLADCIDAVSVVRDCTAITVVPLDWNHRIAEAAHMVAVVEPQFVTLRDAKSALSGVSGVYFGWRIPDGKCVYVGKSSDLGSRLHSRRTELLDCKISYIEMPEEQIHTWELFYIWLHHPERNIEVRLSDKASRSCADIAADYEAGIGEFAGLNAGNGTP
jgi:hypothetical protein